MWGIRRQKVAEQIEANRKLLAKSPTYHKLLAEQAEKGNAESAALLKTLQASGSSPF